MNLCDSIKLKYVVGCRNINFSVWADHEKISTLSGFHVFITVCPICQITSSVKLPSFQSLGCAPKKYKTSSRSTSTEVETYREKFVMIKLLSKKLLDLMEVFDPAPTENSVRH
jgi:hypothetical protein